MKRKGGEDKERGRNKQTNKEINKQNKQTKQTKQTNMQTI
jgi:hypothetical protein